MKIRTDFVTNSSSSSFIVAYRSTAELTADLNKFVNNYDSEWSAQYKDVVFDIFKNRITYKEALKEYAEFIDGKAYYILNTGVYSGKAVEYGSTKNWVNSEEFKQLKKKVVAEKMEEFRRSVNPRGYFALLSYSDSDGYYDVESNLQNMLTGVCIRMDNH